MVLPFFLYGGSPVPCSFSSRDSPLSSSLSPTWSVPYLSSMGGGLSSMPVFSKGVFFIPLPMSQWTLHGGTGQRGKGPSRAVNGQEYKEPSFEGPGEKEGTPSMEWKQGTLNG